MTKRSNEVFVAGCPCCEEAAQTVRDLACQNCDVEVLDMRVNASAQAKARQFGIKRVPAVVVDGSPTERRPGGVNAEALRRLGVGKAA